MPSNSLIDRVWGPSDGLAKIARRTFKFVACLIFAGLVHQAMVYFFLPKDRDVSVAAQLQQISNQVNTLGDVGGEKSIFFAFCGSQEWLSSGLEDCGEVAGEKVLLGFRVHRDQALALKAPVNVILSFERSSWAFVDTPTLVHSVHSILRSIEKFAFNTDANQFASLKLCAGTQKKLDDTACGASGKLGLEIEAALNDWFNGFRVMTLVFGVIQFLTLALFVFVLSESIGRWARWVKPKATLLEIDDTENSQRFRLVENTEEDPKKLSRTIDEFHAASVQSIPDRMTGAAIFVANQAKTEVPLGTSTLQEGLQTSLEGYREFLEAEADTNLDSLHTVNEAMLKVAFVGTIWGISAALFGARELDVADPVEKILAKATMFGSIGTAFGTTLIGVILSIVASTAIQYVTSAWKQKANESYETVRVLSLERLLDVGPEQAKKTRPTVKRRSPFSTLERLGLLIAIVALVLVMWIVVEPEWSWILDQLSRIQELWAPVN